MQLLLNCSTDKTMGASSVGLLEDKSWTLVTEAPLAAWGVDGWMVSLALLYRLHFLATLYVWLPNRILFEHRVFWKVWRSQLWPIHDSNMGNWPQAGISQLLGEIIFFMPSPIILICWEPVSRIFVILLTYEWGHIHLKSLNDSIKAFGGLSSHEKVTRELSPNKWWSLPKIREEGRGSTA